MFLTDYFKRIIDRGALESLDEKSFFEMEIARWRYSPERMRMILGERYYMGDHEILHRKRTAIGKGGEVEEVTNLPNNRIVDNQYARCVNQKVAYLLSKPITFSSKDKGYEEALQKFFKPRQQNLIKRGGIDALNGGLFWLFVNYDQNGELYFQKFKPYEVLPFWKDADHTELDCAIRLYTVEEYQGRMLKQVEKVEIYKQDGIERYDLINGRLHPAANPRAPYFTVEGKEFAWKKIPLICFKFNCFEIPLIQRIKGLQDALNVMVSDLMNNMQEDSRNTLLVIKNYDGQDLSEFRKNLSTFGAVKVKTVDGADGGIDSLKVEVNASNYDLILKTIKKAIVENARSFDAKDERMGSNVNEMNLKSMYADIDLDADDMEAEFQDAMDQLLFFINSYLGYEDAPDVRIIFNRDMIVNESQVIQDLVALGVRTPNRLLLEQLPFMTDVEEAEKLLKEEDKDAYDQAFAGDLNDRPIAV